MDKWQQKLKLEADLWGITNWDSRNQEAMCPRYVGQESQEEANWFPLRNPQKDQELQALGTCVVGGA